MHGVDTNNVISVFVSLSEYISVSYFKSIAMLLVTWVCIHIQIFVRYKEYKFKSYGWVTSYILISFYMQMLKQCKIEWAYLLNQ